MAGDKKTPKGEHTWATSLRSPRDVFRHYSKPKDTPKEPSSTEGQKLSSLKHKVDTGVDTREKLRKAKPSIDRRIGPELHERLDVFETSECQKWYVDNVRESLETPKMGDKLHKFIADHKIYSMGDYARWNTEFAKLVKINLGDFEGETKAITESRIATACQLVMVDYFNCDVFKVATDNGWNDEDGKYGPYTNSIVNRYWIGVHGPTSKKKPAGRSRLSTGFAPKSKKLFMAALYGAVDLITTHPQDEVIPGKKESSQEVLAKKVVTEKEKREKTYDDLDTAGDKLSFKDLVAKKHTMKGQYKHLAKPIAETFGERKGLASKNPSKAPKTFRVLNLLVKAGHNVDGMKIKKDETVEITSSGMFIVRDT
ncbi:MAG TPA: hypothetical protein ENG14_05075, partial [Thermodesulforhabdus norvegica]|nr:hypothetical protein [Thermodesulforhabdus norvegica]